jgi:WD40 repeat protein
VASSPDGRRALSSGEDPSIRLWDVETGREVRRFEAGTGSLSGVAFSPDGRCALSGGFEDPIVRLWRLPEPSATESVSPGKSAE